VIKALLIAESANPEWTSVPLEGWNHAKALREIADCHIVTHTRNREAFLAAGLEEGLDFTAINSDRVAGPLFQLSNLVRGGENKGWTTSTAISSIAYYYFEHLLWKEFGNRIQSKEFDVIHRITPLTPTAASLIATKCKRSGVPFVLGPLNGGLPWPKEFTKARLKELEWLSYFREAYKLLPGYRSTRRDASAIIVGSSATAQQVPSEYHQKCVFIQENAVELDKIPQDIKDKDYSLPLRLVFLGRLVPYKGCDIVIEALHEFIKNGQVQMRIVGDGPERESLEAMAKKYSIEDQIVFTGLLEHSLAYRELAQAHILTFPSIREFGGAVVVEAMANKTVPLVVNYGGPGDICNQQTGLLIPLGSREEIVSSLKKRMGEILSQPDQLGAMSTAARKRALELFTWDKKAQQSLEVYKWVLGQRPDKPNFGFISEGVV
jgi:glycosyltransferase involved in cell wall biosynthesis